MTVASLRSVLRAPEAKLMLLSPVIMMFIFGGMFFNQRNAPPELVRPLIASGGFTFIFFMMLSMVGNQFSFDRAAFEHTCSHRRLEKTSCWERTLPWPLCPGIHDHLTALALSIRLSHAHRPLSRIADSDGADVSRVLHGWKYPFDHCADADCRRFDETRKPKATTILIHTAFVFIFPLALSPTLIPLGIEFLLHSLEYSCGSPLSDAGDPRRSSRGLAVSSDSGRPGPVTGAKREREILEIVTTKGE